MADGAGPIVVDTMVFSWVLGGSGSGIAHLYSPHLQGRPVILAAQTVAELRAGARLRGWGETRRQELETRISRVRVAGVDDRLTTVYADLKVVCNEHGHGLGQKIHDGDRWIAATAVRYGIPLVSHDSIFNGVPSLDLVTELESS